MKKKMFITVGVLFCVLLIGFSIFYFAYIVPSNKILNEVRNTEIQNIDLSRVADGSYVGEFKYSKTVCRVEVIVKNHRIEDIKILENGKTDYAKRAEAVVLKVIEEQMTDVDVVAGATTTSKALLKAVETALK
ncbi:MAG: FMN-binding protein [Bacillota bacterium]